MFYVRSIDGSQNLWTAPTHVRSVEAVHSLHPVSAIEVAAATSTPITPVPHSSTEKKRNLSSKIFRKSVAASQIMSKPVMTLLSSASLESAWQTVMESGFRHFPVSDDSGMLGGIISARDILRHTSRLLHSKAKTVADAMQTTVTVTAMDTDIIEIARVMFLSKIGSMPIVDQDGKAVGIVTRSDILRSIVLGNFDEIWA